MPNRDKLSLKDVAVEIKNPWTKKSEVVRLHTLILKCGSQSKGTLVFLHGFGGSCATYNAFLSELANHYDVFAFDMLGAGCSSKPSFDYVKMNAAQVLDLYVECIDSWIKALELDNFHMVGHSLGAYFGTFYLHRHTDKKVLSFVSVAGAGMTEEPENFALVS